MIMTFLRFARDHVAPRRLSASADFPRDLWADMAKAGLFHVGLPADHGGDGQGWAAMARADRVLARHGGSMGFAGSWTGHQMIARWFVDRFGTPEQRAAWLPGLAAGTLTAAVAISEPEAGAHPKLLKTTATADGADVILDGTKAWVTNGPIADLFIVLAISNREGERKRYSAYLVPRDTPGLELLPMPALDILRPSPHCRMALTGCRVPQANRLGPPDSAYETMALPFRDIEDTVGLSGLAGLLGWLIDRLAALTPADRRADADAERPLGELVALLAVLDTAADRCAAALDAAEGDPDAHAAGIGARLLAGRIAELAKAYRDGFGIEDADVAIAFRDIEGSQSIARGPRETRVTRLGAKGLG